MSRLGRAAARLGGLFGRSRREQELDDELRFHLTMQAEDNERTGMAPQQAREAARRSFGGVDQTKEAYRDQRALGWAEATWQDVRYAVRTLRKSPGYTIAAVLTLALAIGANTAMFSVLNAVLLRPLPYHAPEQLAMLWTELPSQNLREGRSSQIRIEEWQRRSKAFSDFAVFDSVSLTLTAGNGVDQISGATISPNFFSLLGVQPALGRTFTPAEAAARERVVLISHRLWVAQFGGAPDAIGSAIELDGIPFQVIGVVPAGFQFVGLTQVDVWESHTMSNDWNPHGSAASDNWFVIGRMQPNVTVAQAQAEMSSLAPAIDGLLTPAERNRGISVMPLALQFTGSKERTGLWILAAAVLCVLLIAATNVASLSLARGARRERELAVRAALGASRGRITRQLLAESLTLAGAACVVGIGIAIACLQVVRAVQPGNLLRLSELHLDPQIFAWTLGFGALSALASGLAPVLVLSSGKNKGGLSPSGRGGGRSVAGGVATGGLRRVLVVSEFALAIVLLAGAGLLIRSLRAVERVDPGFQPERILSLEVASPRSRPTAQRAEMYQRMLEQVEGLAGVESAGMIGDFFIAGNRERVLAVEGESQIVAERVRFRSEEVSRGFFRTLGTPLLRGRFFGPQDGANAPPVVIINDAMARQLWPGSDPVGRRVRSGAAAEAPWMTVVGVVADMRRQGLEAAPVAQMFQPLEQNPVASMVLFVRTTADDPMSMASMVQSTIRSVEKLAPIYQVTTLENLLGGYLAERRFETGLLIAFAAVALLMAMIGIYGLIQYATTLRTNEIGIRMALGARAGEIFRMILGEGLRLSAAGLGVGLVGAFWFGRAASGLLFGVTATDPLTYVLVSLLLLGVAAAACYFPARRAMKVEPMAALRSE